MRYLFFFILFMMGYVRGTLAQPIPDWPLKGININLDGSRISFRDLDLIQDSGMSLIIFNLKPWQYAKNRHVTKSKAFSAIMDEADYLATYARSLGIASIIEYSQLPLIDKKVGIRSHKFWHDSKYINDIYTVTTALAKRFAKNDAILGYKIMDEPVENRWGRPSLPENWREIQSGIIAAVRHIDPHKYVIVTSGPGGLGREYSNWVPFDDKKIIYGAHFFTPHFFTHQGIGKNATGIRYPSRSVDRRMLERAITPIVQFKKKYNVPILIGSFGVNVTAEGELNYLDDLVNIFTSNDFAWAYWQYNGFKHWNLGAELDLDGTIQYRGPASKRWNLITQKISNGQ